MKATEEMYEAAAKAHYSPEYWKRADRIQRQGAINDIRGTVNAALAAAPPDAADTTYQLFSVEHVQRMSDDLTVLRARDEAMQRVLEAADQFVRVASDKEPPSWNRGKDAWDELESAVSALRDWEG